MNEVYWQYSKDTPAFFRDSLVQFVARTYYLTRDNFDGSRSQAWAGGGWLAFRSGLIGDVFGVHVAAYTSQPIFAPLDEGGTRLLAPPQNSIGVLGQIYGRMQIGDQEIRGGRQLVDTPLINPQDNRMVPNTFEAATVVSLPDKDRNYDYSVGYIWNIKQRDSNDFIPMSEALAGSDVINRGAAFGMLRYRPARRALACSHGLQRPGLHQHGLRPGRVRFQAAEGRSKLDRRRERHRSTKRRSQSAHRQSFRDLSGLCEGADDLCRMDFIRRRFDDRRADPRLFSPYGTKPNYTDMQQVSFDNANEKAVGGSVAYDFGTVGLPGAQRRRVVHAWLGRHQHQHQSRQFPIGANWTSGYNIVPRKAR